MTNECKKEIMKKIDMRRITEETEIRCSLSEVNQRQYVYIDYVQDNKTKCKESDLLFSAESFDCTDSDSIRWLDIVAIGEYLAKHLHFPLITEHVYACWRFSTIRIFS